MKTLIAILSLYILGVIIYAVGHIRQNGNKIHDLEEIWNRKVGQPVILFRLFVMAPLIMILSMLWPIWLFEVIIVSIRKVL